MKWRLLCAGLLVVASATSAMAAGPYLGASGGVAIVHDSDIDVSGVGTGNVEYDTGGAFNLVGGYNFGNARLEAEFGYKSADVKVEENVAETDVTVMSYMINGYFDINTGTAVTPFIGAGIGLLNGELESSGFRSYDSTEFGYQFMAGLGFQATPNLLLDISYRYQRSASDFSEDGVSISYDSSNILAGVRYNF